MSYLKKLFILSTIWISLSTLTNAASLDTTQSFIHFAGKSTLHNFEGQVSDFSGELSEDGGHFEAKVSSMDTQHPKRNKNMFTMFAEKMYPKISCQISETNKISDTETELKGFLTMHGVTRPVQVIASVENHDQGNIYRGEFPVKLSNYDMKPHSVLGLIKVADDVVVNFEFYFPNN